LETSDWFSKEFTPEERTLYDRQFRLEGWDQKLIKNSRVLIAGVGGLGCEIAKNLAMLGVGHLDLVDLDVIEHSNLNRQILFAGAKTGKPKATVAAKKLEEINPNITVKGYHTSLERLDPAIYAETDVIVGGLDSMNARFNLNAQCVRFKKPLVDGGVVNYSGHLYTVFPYENACFECYPMPEAEMDEMAACTVVGVPRKRVHCVFKAYLSFMDQFGLDEADPKNIKHINFIQKEANELAERHNFLPLFSQAEIVQLIDIHDPGIITINAVISSLQSHEVLKILHWAQANKGLGKPIDSYIIFNAMTMKLYSIEKNRNPQCRQCGDKVRRIDVEIRREAPCNEIINSLLEMGFVPDPDMEPLLTIMDFDMVKEIDLDRKPFDKKNKLRNLELVTAAGFKGGEIFITLHIV
jgi:molybdopterin/thiamine biosynthesis adenylyltransferase